MKNLYMFSNYEIEEIDVLKELADSVSVNGEEIICFEILSEIVHGNILPENISKEQLEITSRQLKDITEISSNLIWLDSFLLEKIEPKAQKILINAINNITYYKG